jgi:hypothetical protein
MPWVGDLIGGRYRLTRLIGKGGMGMVFQARHEQLGKDLAVKILLPELASDATLLQRFALEARAASATGHPNIVEVHDLAIAEDGSAFMVMELLRGQDLSSLVKSQGPLEPGLAVRVACQVLAALDAAHRRGVLHRDVKPHNIFLVDTETDLPKVKLLDFGVAKMLELDQQGVQLTCSGLSVGTPAYMAPEQALAGARVDHRADLYSVGVVLYYCLTGRKPWSNRDAMRVVERQAPVPPSELNPAVTARLEAIVLRAMAFDPGDRPADAREMLRDLRELLDAETLFVPRFVPPSRTRRRLWVVLAAAAVGLLVVLVGAGLVGYVLGHQPAAPLAAGAPAAPAVSAAPAAQDAQNMITLTVRPSPPGARVLVDGREVDGARPFVGRFPRDEVLHRIDVASDGFDTETVLIVFDRDRVVDVRLFAAAPDVAPAVPLEPPPASVATGASVEQSAARRTRARRGGVEPTRARAPIPSPFVRDSPFDAQPTSRPGAIPSPWLGEVIEE